MLSIEQNALALKEKHDGAYLAAAKGARHFFQGPAQAEKIKWNDCVKHCCCCKKKSCGICHTGLAACLRAPSQLKCLPYRLTVRVGAVMNCNNLAIIRGVLQKDKPWQTTFLIAVASVQKGPQQGRENTRCRFTFYMTELSPTLQAAHRRQIERKNCNPEVKPKLTATLTCLWGRDKDETKW